MSHPFRVAIIGGGIGGVSVARALARCGIESHLFERSSAFSEVGAGIQLTPNATKVLRGLGLADDLQRYGFLPEAMVGHDSHDGHELFRTPLRDMCPRVFGAHYFHAHRADLHASLRKDITPTDVTFDAQCVSVEEHEDGATALFSDGSRYDASLIVGADGVHSAVRAAIIGSTTAKYTGHMCWRALVPVNHFPIPHVGPDAAFWMGAKAHVVTYYVSSGRHVNVVAVHESPSWVDESWTEPSSTEEMVAAYDDWHSDIKSLLRRAPTETVYKWGLFDRDPIPSWSSDHVTLLGDAAHPMLPFLSQGAAMALEDAYVLAAALKHYGIAHRKRSLAAYEAERVPRTTRVLLESRKRARTYHLPTAEDQARRNAEMARRQRSNPDAVGIEAEWVYDYDATDCVSRFSAAE